MIDRELQQVIDDMDALIADRTGLVLRRADKPEFGDQPDDFLTVHDGEPFQSPHRRQAIADAIELREALGWRDICAAHEHRCLYCGRECIPTMDHIRPTSRGGLDVPSNVAPACSRCNSSKHNSSITEWLRRRPDLSLAAIRERWERARRGCALVLSWSRPRKRKRPAT